MNVWAFVFLMLMISCFDSGAGRLSDPENYTISWDAASLEKVSQEGIDYAGYARCRELANGKLGFAYEADGDIYFRSKTGDTWDDPVLVATALPEVGMAVPDFTVLGDGTLLLGYNPRPRGKQEKHHFSIRTVKSEDHGATWTKDQLVYQAGTDFGNGCWEPVFLQLPNGEIQLYFADESVFTTSNEQRIAMVKSTDHGHSWTRESQTVSFRKGARDGMPVPIWLEEQGQIAVAIEDNGYGPFKPYIIFNEGIEWQNPVGATHKNRVYTMADSLPENDYAGAPYLAQASNGLTLLSFQWGETLGKARMAVAIGDENARNFTNITWPFDLSEERTGHWNSLTVLEDGKILALTSTNGYSETGKTEVWMIKGMLKQNEGRSLTAKNTE